MLRRRLSLLKDLLAPAGSIFVHLDWHVAHYVKVLMDEVFGYDCFRAKIWRYRRWPAKTKNLQRMHDNILYYRRTAKDEPKFNVLYEELAESTKQTFGLQRQLADFSSGHRKPGQVEEETPGAPLSDVWEIGVIAPIAHERVGYPTQKPLALLERILQIATDPGDLVLDCFSGSGTTLEAAERLGRRWIGVDSAKHAVNLTRKRLIRLHRQPRPVETPQFDHVRVRRVRQHQAQGAASEEPRPLRGPPLHRRGRRRLPARRAAARPPHGKRPPPRRDDRGLRRRAGEPVAAPARPQGRRVGPRRPRGLRRSLEHRAEAQPTALRSVVVLSADRSDTLPVSDRDEIEAATGVRVTLRRSPRRRTRCAAASNPPAESTAVPVFYAPLAIVLAPEVSARSCASPSRAAVSTSSPSSRRAPGPEGGRRIRGVRRGAEEGERRAGEVGRPPEGARPLAREGGHLAEVRRLLGRGLGPRAQRGRGRCAGVRRRVAELPCPAVAGRGRAGRLHGRLRPTARPGGTASPRG